MLNKIVSDAKSGQQEVSRKWRDAKNWVLSSKSRRNEKNHWSRWWLYQIKFTAESGQETHLF